MIELILFVCLLQNPNACRDVSAGVQADATPYQCLQKSQQEAAKWIETHPDWRVAKISCGRVGRYARI
jgi:hypothetical protein